MIIQERKSIMCVDNDKQFLKCLRDYLDLNGFECYCFETLKSAKEKLENTQYDFITLDTMFKDEDCVSFIQEFRKINDTPIIVISDNDTIVDKSLFFQNGIDDFLSKPFEPFELILRLKAINRRLTVVKKNLQVNEFELDQDKKIVYKNGVDVGFSSFQFDIFMTLVNNKGEPVSREALSKHLKGIGMTENSRSFDMTISTMRKRIGDDPKYPEHIRSVKGVGYMFVGDVS